MKKDREQKLSRQPKRVTRAVSVPSVNHTFHSVEKVWLIKYVENELERIDEYDIVEVTDESGAVKYLSVFFR